MNDPARPYDQDDVAMVTHFATLTLSAMAPMLQDIDLSNNLDVDCLASDIARACYAMGVCMMEQREILKQGMTEVNDELLKQQ